MLEFRNKTGRQKMNYRNWDMGLKRLDNEYLFPFYPRFRKSFSKERVVLAAVHQLFVNEIIRGLLSNHATLCNIVLRYYFVIGMKHGCLWIIVQKNYSAVIFGTLGDMTRDIEFFVLETIRNHPQRFCVFHESTHRENSLVYAFKYKSFPKRPWNQTAIFVALSYKNAGCFFESFYHDTALLLAGSERNQCRGAIFYTKQWIDKLAPLSEPRKRQHQLDDFVLDVIIFRSTKQLPPIEWFVTAAEFCLHYIKFEQK